MYSNFSPEHPGTSIQHSVTPVGPPHRWTRCTPTSQPWGGRWKNSTARENSTRSICRTIFCLLELHSLPTIFRAGNSTIEEIQTIHSMMASPAPRSWNVNSMQPSGRPVTPRGLVDDTCSRNSTLGGERVRTHFAPAQNPLKLQSMCSSHWKARVSTPPPVPLQK